LCVNKSQFVLVIFEPPCMWHVGLLGHGSGTVSSLSTVNDVCSMGCQSKNINIKSVLQKYHTVQIHGGPVWVTDKVPLFSMICLENEKYEYVCIFFNVSGLEGILLCMNSLHICL
jgi:hypothetical protein